MLLPSLRSAITLLAPLLSGCSGKLTYSPPGPAPAPASSVTIDHARQDVWRTLIPQLARTFFVINNLDQASGLINVSYSGDPERFVDCGRIVSNVSNLRGTRNYDFPAARAQQQYEVMEGSGLYGVARTMSLEGRANIVLEEISATATRMTVNIRYVVTKHVRIQPVGGGPPREGTESISFNSGDGASFQAATTCRSTGQLERQLLDLVTAQPGG